MLCPECLKDGIEINMKVTNTYKTPQSVEEYNQRVANGDEAVFVERRRECPKCGYVKKSMED